MIYFIYLLFIAVKTLITNLFVGFHATDTAKIKHI